MARQGDVVIRDDMTAQSGDYQGFAPFFGPSLQIITDKTNATQR